MTQMSIPHLKRHNVVALVLFLVSVLSFESKAQQIFLTGKAGTWSFAVQTPGKSAESTSGIGAYQAGLGFGVLNQFTFEVNYNVLASQGIGGQIGIGFDFGAKYYPLTSNGFSNSSNNGVDVSTSELWRPYVGAGFRQRQFILTLSTEYAGPGAFIGTDYVIDRHWFLIGEIRYDMYAGPSKSQATQQSIYFGLGHEL